MSCESSGRTEAGDPSLRLGGSSSTCSSSTCSLEGDPGETSKISGGWTKKSIGGSEAIIEEIYGSSRKISKTKEVDREAWK